MHILGASVSKGKERATGKLPSVNSDPPSPDVHESISSEEPSDAGCAPAPSQQLPRPILFRQARSSYFITALLVLLSLLFGVLIGLVLLTHSLAAPALRNINDALSDSNSSDSAARSNEFWKQAILVQGPDSISVTGTKQVPTPDGCGERLEVNLTVSIGLGVDTDYVMGFREDDDEDTSWFHKKWKELGRWGITKLETVAVAVDDVRIYPLNSSNTSKPIVQAKLPSPVSVPLHPGLSTGPRNVSLKALCVPITIYPTQNSTLLLEFIKESWSQGFFSLRIQGSGLTVLGGKIYDTPFRLWDLSRWRNLVEFAKPNVTLRLSLPVPSLHVDPRQPPIQPGSKIPDLASLLVLESFNITPSTLSHPDPSPSFLYDHSNGMDTRKRDQSVLALEPPRQLAMSKAADLMIHARASLPHPFASLGSKVGLGKGVPAMPFTVSLPEKGRQGISLPSETIPVVKVWASPEFNETHIVIPLSGYVLPLSNSSDRLPDAVSAFVSSHLSYLPSPISITTPLYPSLAVNASFPPPKHRLELLKDITIENMSITGDLSNLDILVSGTVHARVVLPHGFNIGVQVIRLWVDCLVYDGEIVHESGEGFVEHPDSGLDNHIDGVPSDVDTEKNEPPLPEPSPLPNPLPPRAFGRMKPRTWLNATSASRPPTAHLSSSQEEGTSVYVTAQIIDVPLEVLPGRQGGLSRFVTKVLFSSSPVAAGIRGFAAVGLSIPGFTTPSPMLQPRLQGNELILNGLPVQGNLRVGGRVF